VLRAQADIRLQDIPEPSSPPAKRKKSQTDSTLERMESITLKVADLQAKAQTEQALRVAEIQAKAQTEQAKIMAEMMRDMLQALKK
jgi:hypothetical protein